MEEGRVPESKPNSGQNKRDAVLKRAHQIILQDMSIPAEEKRSLLKLVQVLVEAADLASTSLKDEHQFESFTEQIISDHALMTQVRKLGEELDALRSLSLNLTSSLDLAVVLDAVVTEAMRLVKNARTAHIFLYTRGQLEFGAALNSDGRRNSPLAMPRKNGLTYSVARSGKPLVIEDMSNDPLYQDTPDSWTGSIIGIPLNFSNNVVGVMNLSRSTVGGFTSSELRLLGLLSDQAAAAISNASLHKMVTEQAHVDSVTGLPNRRALDERLEEEARFARQSSSPFAVIMMDLDGFKAVNDSYGHDVGDEVLRSVFNYLASGMRTTDFLARYGGDELTLILHQSDVAIAKTVGDKILTMVKEYAFVRPNGEIIRLGMSGGIAVYPLHSRTGIDLLRAADTALYEAKKHRRGTFVPAREATAPLDPLKAPRNPDKAI